MLCSLAWQLDGRQPRALNLSRPSATWRDSSKLLPAKQYSRALLSFTLHLLPPLTRSRNLFHALAAPTTSNAEPVHCCYEIYEPAGRLTKLTTLIRTILTILTILASLPGLRPLPQALARRALVKSGPRAPISTSRIVHFSSRQHQQPCRNLPIEDLIAALFKVHLRLV